jgi:hypothetical protein
VRQHPPEQSCGAGEMARRCNPVLSATCSTSLRTPALASVNTASRMKTGSCAHALQEKGPNYDLHIHHGLIATVTSTHLSCGDCHGSCRNSTTSQATSIDARARRRPPLGCCRRASLPSHFNGDWPWRGPLSVACRTNTARKERHVSWARTVYPRQHAPRARNVPGICARYHAHMKATLVLACRGARAQACGAQNTWLTRDDQDRGACTALCDAMERELTLGCNARKRSTDRVA